MIAILKYDAGNIQSVKNALDRLSYKSMITDSPEEIQSCDKLIIPGVGEAGTAMRSLQQKGLVDFIRTYSKPVLGICLGMQILCSHSEESDTDCLGIFQTNVYRFKHALKVPHMGWNSFTETRGPLFKGIKNDDDMYYVHSYYAGLSDHTSSACCYGLAFSASLERDNFFGTQFHPEKSADQGERVLQNFLSL